MHGQYPACKLCNQHALREQWECNIITCKSDFCFVPADGLHFPLGHGHFEKWAAAMVCTPSHPTLLSSNVHLCSSFVATIWPAWKSCQTSCYLIQFHLTQLYQSCLFCKPTSMRSAKKNLHLPCQQLWSSMSCYQTTCSIPTNIDRFYQHHKWPISYCLPMDQGHGWAWSSSAVSLPSPRSFSVDWIPTNILEHRLSHIWSLMSYGSWVSSQERLWTWRKQC